MSETQPQTNAVETVLDHAQSDTPPEEAGLAEVSEAVLRDIDDVNEGDLSVEVVGQAIGEALGRELGARLGGELGEWIALRVRDAIKGDDEAGSLTEMLRSWVRALREWFRTALGGVPGVGESAQEALPGGDGEIEDTIPVLGGEAESEEQAESEAESESDDERAESDEEASEDRQDVVDRVRESFDVSAEEARDIVLGDDDESADSDETADESEQSSAEDGGESGGSETGPEEFDSDTESAVTETGDESETEQSGESDDASDDGQTSSGDDVAADEGTVDEAVSAESEAGAVEEEIEADAEGAIDESAESVEEGGESGADASDADDSQSEDASEDDSAEDGGDATKEGMSKQLDEMSKEDLQGLAQDLVDELKQRQEESA